MARGRFFSSRKTSPDARRVVLTGEEYHHLVRVTRAKVGDDVSVLDGSGGIFETTLRRIGREEAVLEVRSYRKGEPPRRIDMALALTRAHRLDFAVEKCSEIGLRRFLPFVARRSVWRGGERETAHKRGRLERKVAAACKQSGNPYFPTVEPVMDFAALLATIGGYGVACLADPAGGPVESAVARITEGDVLGIVGPEGGFTDGERERLVAAGAVPISLGPHLLRSETAAICLLFRLGEGHVFG
jgi:16S rRNA (uracil1498-N3)-methyltransferase